ncbi:hypothetical protein V8C35DRAFT_72204 [Trichoderma chlorosporum]
MTQGRGGSGKGANIFLLLTGHKSSTAARCRASSVLYQRDIDRRNGAVSNRVCDEAASHLAIHSPVMHVEEALVPRPTDEAGGGGRQNGKRGGGSLNWWVSHFATCFVKMHHEAP